MSITKNSFLTEIQTALEEYGSWEIADGGTLETNLFYAMQDLWEKRDWSFKFSSGTITTTEGVQGPYTPPTGFEALVTPEALSKYFDYDRYSVPPPIPDSTNGEKYQISHDRLNGKIWFRNSPPGGDLAFYFLRALENTADLSAWPSEARRFLKFKAMSYCLADSEDTVKQGQNFEARAEAAFQSMLKNIRRSESKQDTREPRDVYGYPMAQSFSNEGDGFLGGR